MKKIFGMLLILVSIYLGIQVVFRFFGAGHEYMYQVNTNGSNFNVKEKFINNKNNELNSYYFEISYNNEVFYYQTLDNFGKKDHIIKNIYSFNNDKYSCILPIFEGNKIITDIMCLKNNIIYYYHNLTHDNDLKKFVDSLTEYGYDINQWIDNNNNFQIYENITIYPENIIQNHHISFSNYKGVYVINPSVGNIVENVKLFKNDAYKRTISTIFKNFYITANYDEKYRFTKILTVDLDNSKTQEINCGTEISFDSYIQGINDNSIYIFDRSSKKQYEINLKNKKVLEVGNENSGIIVYNGNEKNRINASEAVIHNILFNSENNNKLDIDGYVKIDLFGGKETGYYYLYKKEGNIYNVYRTNVQNTDQITYIFSTTDLNRITYHNGYVYFLDGNIIKYYNDATGVKSIIENKELSFNDSLIFGIYEK